MAGQNRALSFTFTTDDQQALAALRRMEKGFKGLDVQVDRTRKTGLSFGQSLGGLALGAGAVFSVNEFEEAEKGMRATEAVIRSTGNAAEVSAEQQAKYVDELSRLAAVDDDVVNGGANMLRTFTEIKGENFGAALAASLDLAAFKGQDLASTAEQIGKALNDPVAGMGKLAKQGVVLSAVQKQQIRDFAAVGDIASAQKVILQELETEYGGQAEAAVTSSARMKVALGEAGEEAGRVLAPAVTLAANGVGVLGGAMDALPGPAQTAVFALAAGAVAAKKIEDRFEDAGGTLTDFTGTLSKLDKGLLAASAGVTSFALTTAGLDAVSNFKGDVEDLNSELALLADGESSVSDITTALGTDLDGLTGKFKQASDAPKDWKDALGEVFSKGTEVIDTRQAQETIKKLDEALAEMASSGNAEGAAAAFDEIVQALADQGLSYNEIIPLLPKYISAQDRVTRGSKAEAEGHKEAGEALESYSDRVAEAIDKAHGINDAQRSYTDAQADTVEAYQELADAQRAASGNSSEYRDAVDAVRDAEEGVADAARQTQRAQEDLTRARKDAAETLEDLRFAAEGSVLSEERAKIALEEARLNKRKVDRDRKSTPLEKKKAALDLAEAELALKEAQDRREDSASALAEADANGIENAPNVVAAKEAIASALDNQREAERRVGEASANAASVLVEAKGRVSEASKKLDDAIRTEADLHADAAEKIYGAAGANSVYLQTLRKHAEMLAPGSDLRRALESYIADVERLSATVIRTPPASAQPGGGQTGTIGHTGNLSRSGGAGGNVRTGGDAVLNMNVGTINVTGTGRDMEAAIEKAGRHLARAVKAA